MTSLCSIARLGGVAKEAEDVATPPKCSKNPPPLTFAREGGEKTGSPHPAHFASNGDGGGGGSTNICEKRPPPARF